MAVQVLVFTEEPDYFYISGSADVCVFKTSGDILVGRPFPVNGAIQRSAVVGFRREGQRVFLLWKQSGHDQKTFLGLCNEDVQDWLDKVNAFYV